MKSGRLRHRRVASGLGAVQVCEAGTYHSKYGCVVCLDLDEKVLEYLLYVLLCLRRHPSSAMFGSPVDPTCDTCTAVYIARSQRGHPSRVEGLSKKG